MSVTLFSNKVVHVVEEGRGGENAGGGDGIAMIICTYKILHTG